MGRVSILICLLLGGMVGPAAGQLPDSTAHTLSGLVVDEASGDALAGAHVYVPSLKRGTSTNNQGFYSLSLPGDSVTVVVSYLGYEQATISLRLQSDRRRTIRLSRSAVQADSVRVTARQTPLQQTTRTSTVRIEGQRAEDLPTVLGEADVLKALQLMPGVQSGGEGTSGLYVRGGTPDQNLLLLDGAPLYNASHLFGAFSVFNPDIVQNVELMKGGFPARYGGHLSSVVKVNVEEGHREDHQVDGSVGFVSSRLTVQGPISGENTSFLIAGRRTYADLLTRAVSDPNGGYFFYDVNAKLNHRFSETDRLIGTLYVGDDRFYSAGDSEGEFDFGWGNIMATLRWNHVFESDLFGTASFRYSRYQFDVSANEEDDGDTFRLRYRSEIEDLSLGGHLEYTPNARHEVHVGGTVTYQQFRPGATQYNVSRAGEETGRDTTIAPAGHIRAVDAAVYAQDEIEWTERLATNVGVRAAMFAVGGRPYGSIQPRLSARYLLPNDWAVKGSYSLMWQPVHRLTNSTIGLPTDLWVPSTRAVPPEQSHQVTLGLSRSFRNRTYEVRMEGYGKLMDHLVEYKQGASFSLVAGEEWDTQVETGRGWSYGGEVLLRKTRGRMSGWVSYTLSWTRRQFDGLNEGEAFPFRYDRRHDFSTTLTYDLTDVTSATATWVYSTGKAVTLPQSRYRGQPAFDDQRRSVPEEVGYSDRNGFRMPSYHRLDLGLRFQWGDRDGFHALRTGAYNAYNRKNPYFVNVTDGRRGGLDATAVSIFPVLPYVSYQFKF